MTSRIGLILAVPQEGMTIMRQIGITDSMISHGLVFSVGKIHNKSIVYVATGIGKTNASRGATILIERFSPTIIINFGVGGAYPLSGLNIGDIAIAEKEIYGDEGISLKDGFHTAETIGIPLLVKGRKKYFNEFQLDKKLLKNALNLSAQHSALEIRVKSGPFLTLSTCTGTLKRAGELAQRFHAICENMEGAAIAHICTAYRIPMVEIRGISNTVGDRDRKKWNIKTAAKNCQKVVMEFLKHYNC